MIRHLMVVVALAVMIGPAASFAGAEDDPFEGGMAVEYSAEFFTLGTQYDTHDTTLLSLGFLYETDLDTLLAGTISRLGTLPQIGSIRDMAAADFDGDLVDEILAAWSRPDGGVFVGIIEPDPDSMGVDTAAWHVPDVPGAPGMLYASDSLAHVLGEIRVIPAQLYPDAAAEFVLAYLAADSTVRVSVFDVDSASLKPVELHAVSDQILDTWIRRGQRFGRMCRFDIAGGDFDGDGIDEVTLVVQRTRGVPVAPLKVVAYDYDTSTHSLVPAIEESFFAFFGSDSLSCLRKVFAASGHLDNDSLEEVVVVDSWANHAPDSTREVFMHVLHLDMDRGIIPNSFQVDLDSASWRPRSEFHGAQKWALQSYHGELIAGGYDGLIGLYSAEAIVRWNGAEWRRMGVEPGEVLAMTEHNGELMIGGNMRRSDLQPFSNVARWNGVDWEPVGHMMSNGIQALLSFNGDLIAAGELSLDSGVTWINIARWDDSAWHALGTGINGTVWDLAEYNGDLVAAGDFSNAGGTAASNIARWDGSSWFPLGSGVNAVVLALTVYDSDLVAGGFFTQAGGSGANRVARWNGSTWQSLGSGTNDGVYCATVLAGDLYVGGRFTSPGTRIARWNGSSWSAVGSGISGDPTGGIGFALVTSVGEYEGDLIASGHFTTAGGAEADAIARWDGSNWYAMGSGRELPLGLAVQDIDYPSDDSLDDVIIAVPTGTSQVRQRLFVFGCDGGTGFRESMLRPDPLPYAHPAYGSRRQLVAADILGGNPSRLMLLAGDTAVNSVGFPKTRVEIYEIIALKDSTCGALQIPLRDTWTSEDQFTDVVAADLDTLSLRLGPPVYYRKTNIVQPLVVLNAPPTHFDVIRDTVWDVNFRYGANPDNCEAFATYKEATGSTVEMKTEVKRDWGVSSSLDVSLGAPGAKVKAHLETTYGEGFSNVEQNLREIQLTATVTTGDDDQVYATQVDYDIWEYPVIKGGKRVPGGGIVVVAPNTVEDVFSAGKNPDREGWIPDHEVENALSYPRLTDLLDNPQVASGNVITKGNTGFTLDEYPWSADWAVVQSDFSADEVTESWNAGYKVGVSASAEASYLGYSAGIEAGLEYEYSESEVQTFKTTVTDACSLGVFLGCINTGYGVVNYRVTPYAYWATSGALVLDYAVSPAVAQQGEDPTWWQVYYGEADPALVLPWRLDDDKGEPLTSEASRFKTKEIFFHPSTPRPGQDVTMTVRVHNYGLTATAGPVKVSFYLGDPDLGGILLAEDGGFTTFETATALQPQGSSLASMVWRVPSYGSIAECQRIWVVVDPLDEIGPEVHDNDERKTNNKGWKLLRVDTDPQCIDTDGDGYGDPAYRCSSCPTAPVFDNCPGVYNPEQTDTNGDGIGDACEQACAVSFTGDVDESGSIVTSDIIYMVNFMFRDGPACRPCHAAGDVECSGTLSTADIIYLVNYVLKGGPAPCDVCSMVPSAWACP